MRSFLDEKWIRNIPKCFSNKVENLEYTNFVLTNFLEYIHVFCPTRLNLNINCYNLFDNTTNI